MKSFQFLDYCPQSTQIGQIDLPLVSGRPLNRTLVTYNYNYHWKLKCNLKKGFDTDFHHLHEKIVDIDYYLIRTLQ